MGLSIYKSSAGSGKTYTLAMEYIKILLQNPLQHPHILAVTFTNKATQEMKGRILAFLTGLSNGTNESLLKQLIKDTGYSSGHIVDNSRKALQEILHNYSDFTVLTIDAFFNRIIKAFAHEMKLPLKMEVQLDIDEALNDAYDRMLLSLDINPELRSYLTEFMGHKLAQDRGWNVEREIKELGKELFKESFNVVFRSLEKVELAKIRELVTELHSEIAAVQQPLEAWGQEAFQILDELNIEISTFKGGKNSFANYFKYLAEFRVDKLELTKTQQEAIGEQEKWHKKNDPNELVILEAFNSGLNRILTDASEFWLEKKSSYWTAVLILKNIHALGLLKNINEQIKAYRDENDKILISDQNRMIGEIIGQSAVPFIYEKTGGQFRHFLLDEFQDTSAMQWINFRPLLENTLSEGGRVLIVGDAKQSIYRWRGGEMQLLLQKVTDDLPYFTNAETVKNLDSNYRSSAEIIDFNNTFFNGIGPWVEDYLESSSPLTELAYVDAEQKHTAITQPGGFLRFEFCEEETIEETVSDAKEVVDHKVLSQVADLIDEGFQFRDLALLVMTNADGNRVAALLNEQEIPVQSSESLWLKNSPLVQLLLSMLKYQQNSDDALTRAQVIVQLHQLALISVPLHETLLLAKHSNKEFLDTLPEPIRKAMRPKGGTVLQTMVKLIDELSIQQLEPDYLQRLLEIIFEYEAKNESHAGEFLEWWYEKEERHSIQAYEDQNAITIITVHKAKGLQFPVVIMPYLTRRVEPKGQQILWIENEAYPALGIDYVPIGFSSKLQQTDLAVHYTKEKEHSLIDSINMIYVAFTRPEKRLYVFGAKGADRQMNISRLIEDNLHWNMNLDPPNENGVWTIGNKAAPTSSPEDPSPFVPEESLVVSSGGQLLLRGRRDHLFEQESPTEYPIQPALVLRDLLMQLEQEEDIETTVERAIFQGDIRKGEKQQWINKVTTILQIPQLLQCMSECIRQHNGQEILAEQTILKPDKIFELEGKLVVVNIHKTPNPSQHDLIKQCVRALSNIEVKPTGTTGQLSLGIDQLSLPVEGYLLYTENAKLESI